MPIRMVSKPEHPGTDTLLVGSVSISDAVFIARRCYTISGRVPEYWRLFMKPEDDFMGIGVDFGHELDLVVPLGSRVLIDTQLRI